MYFNLALIFYIIMQVFLIFYIMQEQVFKTFENFRVDLQNVLFVLVTFFSMDTFENIYLFYTFQLVQFVK